MIKKHTALSFAFCALIVSSTLASVISCAAANTEEVANLTPETAELSLDTANPEPAQGKTTKQRIVSGLAHTVLLVPSIPMAGLSLFGFSQLKDSTMDRHDVLLTAALFITSGYSFSSAIKNISSAIKNSPEEPAAPVTKIDLSKKAVLGVSSIVLLHTIASGNSSRDWLDVAGSIPGVYGLISALKTFSQAARQQNQDT